MTENKRDNLKNPLGFYLELFFKGQKNTPKNP